MNKLLAYISLGISIFGLVPVLAAQIKNPATLNADVVWSEVFPILMQVDMATGHTINMGLAEKITRNAVLEVKTWYQPKV